MLCYLPRHEDRQHKLKNSQNGIPWQVKSCVSLLIGPQFFPGRAWEVFGGSWQAGPSIRQTGEKCIHLCFALQFLSKVNHEIHFIELTREWGSDVFQAVIFFSLLKATFSLWFGSNCRSGGYTCTSCTARTNLNLSTLCQSISTLTLK